MATKKAKAPAKKTVKDFAEKVAAKLAPEPVPVVEPEPEPIVEPLALDTDMAVVVSPQYDLARPETLIPIIQVAWNAVRAGDAPYEVCDPAFRMTLMAHATDFFKTGIAMSGDSHLARFEQQLQAIRKGE